jgi:hypothetical protein
MRRLIAAACVLACIPVGAALASEEEEAAPTEAVAAATSAKASKNRDDEIVCRSERLTGSRVVRARFCLTRREWRELSEKARRDVEAIQEGGSWSAPDGYPGSRY